MVELADRGSCTGCAACATVCAKGAIRMLPDDEGFLMPQIDSAVCVGCGRCAKVCPVLNAKGSAQSKNPAAFVARAKDGNLRLASTSGGVFSLLAQQVLRDGGVVFGAAYDPVERRGCHQAIMAESDLCKLRGAKYVQSDVGSTYAEVCAHLKAGRAVLYSGTPCQIAALKASVAGLGGASLDRLLTVEVVCNSVPSPVILRKWLEASGADHLEGQSLRFRDKTHGWRSRTLMLSSGERSMTLPSPDVYYDLWQKGYTVRRSCLSCRFRNLQSGADVTIGDAWGIEGMGSSAAKLDDGKGVSVILANTERGRRSIDRISDLIDLQTVSFPDVIRGNPALVRTPDYLFTAGERRTAFWRAARNSTDVICVARRFTRPPLKMRIRHLGGRVLRKLGLRK